MLISAALLAVSGPDSTLIAAAAVTVVAAVVTGAVTIINTISAASDRRIAAESNRLLLEQGRVAAEARKVGAEKTDAIIHATTQIHELTNSTNSNLQKALEVMTEKVVGMEKLISQMENEKKTIASNKQISDLQTQVALKTPVPPVSEEKLVGKAEEILTSIDDNTLAIERNTAKTRADVKDLKDNTKT
jgi:hypothetical protein